MKEKITDSEIITTFAEVFRENDTSKDVRERSWYRNILYMVGEQHLNILESTGTFINRYSIQPDIPQSCSNVIRDYVKAACSLMLNKNYAVRVWANSAEQSDKDAAELAENVLQYSDDVGCHIIDDVKEKVTQWMMLTGNGFCRTFPDMDNGKYIVDKSGKVVQNRGDVGNEAISPFNITVPILGEQLQDKRFVGISSLKDKEWVESTFGVELKQGDTQGLMEYQRQLQTLIANVSNWKGAGLDTTSDMDIDADHMVVFQEIEYKPTMKHPKGQYYAVAGGEVLVKQDRLPIPVDDDSGAWFYTLEHFSYNATPGAFWATSGIDDLISPQNTINEIDQALVVNRKSIGRPWILTPKELVLSRKSAAGNPFLQLEYDPTVAQGMKPEIVQGMPYPSQVLDERNLAKETIQEAAGDPKHIMRGQSPQSGASGVMVDILKEAAEQTHTPDVERFYRSWTRVNKKRLILAQELFTEERLIKIPGQGSEISVKQFKGADLYNNTDVRLELDNKTASTHAGRNQFVLSLLQNQFFGDLEQKPEIREHLMERFGITVPTQTNIHTERAKRENSAIVYGKAEDIRKIALPAIPVTDENGEVMIDPETGEPRTIEVSSDPLFMYDDHQIHVNVLDDLLLSKEFDSLEGHIKLVAISHRKMHAQVLEQQQQQEQEQLQQQMEQEEFMKKQQKA